MEEEIKELLDEQEIIYELLSKEELNNVDKKWRDKFIGNRTAPYIEQYRWHIFSYNKTNKLEGDSAIEEYKKQHPTDIYIFLMPVVGVNTNHRLNLN